MSDNESSNDSAESSFFGSGAAAGCPGRFFFIAAEAAARPPVGEPFDGRAAVDAIPLAESARPALAELRPDAPVALAAVIGRAMEKEPERRYGDMPAFIAALREAAAL
jgi:hypothetical protein